MTLAASTTAPQAGQTVTLTATANTDVGPTPYGLSIVDTTTNTLLAHVGTGTTVTTTVTQNTATTQNYVGRIDTQGGDPVAATSTPITVTWTATTPPPATAPTVISLSPTSGTSAGGTPVTITGTGFADVTGVYFGSAAASSYTVASASSINAVAPAGTGTVNVTVTTPTQTSATTTSDTFTYTAQYSVTLAASTTAPQAGQTVTLTATANTDVGPTPYGLSIVDTTTNTLLAHVGTGTTVTTTVTQNTATTQNYVGRIDTQGGDPVAATSTPITVTWTATTPPPPPAALSEAASFPVNSESDGNSSIAVTPQKVGDLLIVSMQLHSTSVEVKSVSGGNGGTWHRATRFVDSANTLSYEVWYTSATRTGTADITLTYSAPTALPIELIADSFTGAPHGSWSVVASGGRSNAASSAIYWPRLTSGKASLQLYWGASEEHTAGTGVTTPGFVAQDTANGNEFIADPSLAPLTAYSPVGTDSPANVSTAVGVIFAAS